MALPEGNENDLNGYPRSFLGLFLFRIFLAISGIVHVFLILSSLFFKEKYSKAMRAL